MLIYPSPVSECTHACFFVTVVCFHSESPSPCLHLGDHYSIILVFQDLPSSPHLWSVQAHTVTWASSISPLLIIISATLQMTLTPDSQSSAAPSQTVLLSQWLRVVHQFSNLASKITDLFHSILAAHFQGAFLYLIIARASPDSEILNCIITFSNQNLQCFCPFNSLILITSALLPHDFCYYFGCNFSNILPTTMTLHAPLPKNILYSFSLLQHDL